VHGSRIETLVHEEGYGVPGYVAVPHQIRILVARHAILVGRTGIVEDPPLFVGGVAIHTCRDLMGLFFPESPLDDLNVHLFDAGVALCTGGGHLIPGDAGSGIGMGEDVVGGVAGSTNRRHAQTGPEEAIPVDGHGVVLQDPVLGDVPGPSHRSPLTVTLSA
jgi:hypothetical protein